jgi:hypothetical protein
MRAQEALIDSSSTLHVKGLVFSIAQKQHLKSNKSAKKILIDQERRKEIRRRQRQI